jgi:hypothetical protein
MPGCQYDIWLLVSLVCCTLFIIFLYKHISLFSCTYILLSAHYVHSDSDFIAIFWLALLYLSIPFVYNEIQVLGIYIVVHRGTRWRSWLRNYAASRKVAGSISDEVTGFFNWPNPSSLTMALGSTRHVTEMSTRNLLGGKWRPARKLTTSPSSVSLFSRKCGSLDVSQPYEPSWSFTGICLCFFLPLLFEIKLHTNFWEAYMKPVFLHMLQSASINVHDNFFYPVLNKYGYVPTVLYMF